MGKRIEDLKVDDTPITTPIVRPAEDAREPPWYQLAATIDELLESGEYDWAFGTLAGIRETIEKTRRVSEGQRRAVENVQVARELPGRRRRYEGWGWGGGRR